MAAIHNIIAGGGVRVSVTKTYNSNSANQSVDVTTLPGYIAGATDTTIVVDSGIYVYSTSISTPALTISGGIVGDRIYLVNNGYIIGMGGRGAYIGPPSVAAEPGGPALSILNNVTATNNSYIAGGGGGGGRGGEGGGGGGAGGGQGGNSFGFSGGAGGAPGAAGADGDPNDNGSPGGGGGRIIPGTGGAGGTSSGNSDNGKGGGAGGGGGSGDSSLSGLTGGAGGSANNPGNNTPSSGAGGGGGWGAAGGTGFPAGTQGNTVGGAGGKAINLNGYAITWVNTGTIWGAVS